VFFERERGVYDVDVTASVAHVVATVGDESGRAARTQSLFRALADAAIPVFLVKLHGQAVTFCIETAELEHAERVLTDAGFTFRTRRDLAIVTVHAGTMRDLIGIMVRIADALQLAQARMYGVGDSHSSVQCLIDGYRADAAVKQLRSAFHLEARHE
jgi:aspartokinase